MEKVKSYLGFNLGFNSSAAIYNSNKEIVSAISQERLNNVKNTKEIPFDAMLECCRIAEINEIDGIAFSHYQELTWAEILEKCPEQYKDVCVEVAKNNLYENVNAMFFEILRKVFNQNGIKLNCLTLERVNHHEAHLNAGLAFYGISNNYVGITMDGFGDALSGTMQYFNVNGVLNGERYYYQLIDSIALIYQFVTGALGFKMHQHEGKITGLASYGKPLFVDMFKERFCFGGKMCEEWIVERDKLLPLDEDELVEASNSPISNFDDFLRLRKTVFDFVKYLKQEYFASKQDIASSVQVLTEEVMINRIKQYYNYSLWKNNVVCILSGGLFANVTLNKRIKDLNLFSEVLVTPFMGDEGTAIGSASYFVENKSRQYINEKDREAKIVNSIFLGTKMNSDLTTFSFYDNSLIEELANKLKDKKVVCICQGRMEFGPRALCHRSILYDCTEKSVNEWLNKKLGRTEFMPFAPVCLEEDASKLFSDYDSANELTSKFMTITMNCTSYMKEKYPGAVHIDGTARPQIIGREKENMFARKLLMAYKARTGKEVLINTSFNLHNNPIIESEKVAVWSWKKSELDVLMINEKVLENEGGSELLNV
jgi:carbamoyltransferase